MIEAVHGAALIETGGSVVSQMADDGVSCTILYSQQKLN
jgi:hypothetical protein